MEMNLENMLNVMESRRAWVAQSVKRLTSVQVMISGSWGGAPR